MAIHYSYCTGWSRGVSYLTQWLTFCTWSFLTAFPWNKNLYRISFKFVPTVLTESVLVQVIAWCGTGIDTSHKSHNALDKHPTMHHFVTERCTQHVHISVTKWYSVRYGTDVLWDLCNRSIMQNDVVQSLIPMTENLLESMKVSDKN